MEPVLPETGSIAMPMATPDRSVPDAVTPALPVQRSASASPAERPRLGLGAPLPAVPPTARPEPPADVVAPSSPPQHPAPVQRATERTLPLVSPARESVEAAPQPPTRDAVDVAPAPSEAVVQRVEATAVEPVDDPEPIAIAPDVQPESPVLSHTEIETVSVTASDRVVADPPAAPVASSGALPLKSELHVQRRADDEGDLPAPHALDSRPEPASPDEDSPDEAPVPDLPREASLAAPVVDPGVVPDQVAPEPTAPRSAALLLQSPVATSLQRTALLDPLGTAAIRALRTSATPAGRRTPPLTTTGTTASLQRSSRRSVAPPVIQRASATRALSAVPHAGQTDHPEPAGREAPMVAAAAAPTADGTWPAPTSATALEPPVAAAPSPDLTLAVPATPPLVQRSLAATAAGVAGAPTSASTRMSPPLAAYGGTDVVVARATSTEVPIPQPGVHPGVVSVQTARPPEAHRPPAQRRRIVAERPTTRRPARTSAAQNRSRHSRSGCSRRCCAGSRPRCCSTASAAACARTRGEEESAVMTMLRTSTPPSASATS